MFNKTDEEQIQSAIELLIDRGHAIMEQEDFGPRGYHIVAHCFETGKNECFKPANGVLYKWEVRSGKFGWYKFAQLPYRQKKSYYKEMSEAINSNKNSH